VLGRGYNYDLDSTAVLLRYDHPTTYITTVDRRAGKNLGLKNRFLKGFLRFFLLADAGHKITTHKQRFGHVNATNRNSYLNIICIKLVTQVKKNFNN